MRHLLILSLFIVLFHSITKAATKPEACSLTSFVAEYDLSTCDGELVGIAFNFTGTEFGLGGFKVIGPMGTQTYQLGDDYIYYVIASCNEVIELTLQDNNEPNCSLTIELDAECCECVIQPIVIETSTCINGVYTLYAEINASSGSCLTNGWTVTVCGNTYTMQAGQGNYFATGISCTAQEVEYQFCSLETGECFTKVGLNPCYNMNACELTSFTAQYISNGCSGETKAIEFSFTGTAFGLNGYFVHNGSQEQFYAPGDPQIFETPAACDGPVQLTIVDAEDPGCSLTTTLDPACCPCEVENLEVFTGACNNGSFAVEISMDIISGSCFFGDWTLTVNNVIYPLTFGGTNWVAAGVTSQDSLVVLEICNPTAAWCEIVIVPNPCWQGGNSNCEIISFVAAYAPGLCNGELAGIEFEYNALNFGNGGFTVSDGNTTETYMPGDDLIFYVPASCNNNVVLTLQDINDPTCSATVVLAEACCPCEVDTIQVWTSPCTNGTFEVLAFIDITGGSCFFGDWVLIINNDTYPMVYNSNSWVAQNVSSTDSLITAFICHPATAFCEQVTFVNPCFNSSPGCSITSFSAVYSQNYCDDELAGILFSVTGTAFGTSGFTVSSGTYTSSYNPGDDYLFYVPATCMDSILLVIEDNADSTCTADVWLSEACCPCVVNTIEAETFDCVNGSFGIEVYIDIAGGSCHFGDWTLTVGNTIYPLTFNGLYWTAMGITSADSIVIMTLCHPVTGYCETIAVVNPCYNATSSCVLTTFTAAYAANGCDGELTAITFSFTGSGFGTNGYYITSANATQTYQPGDSMVFYLPALCGDSIWLVLSDVANGACSLGTAIGPACCPCILDSIVVETGPCNGGNFNIVASLFIEEGSCFFGDWTVTAEGLSYPLYFNNNGELEANITAIGEWVALVFCHTSTGFCDTVWVENPCFGGSNNCVLNIESVALENVTTFVNAALRFHTVNTCSPQFTVSVNDQIQDSLFIEDSFIFVKSLPIDVPTYHFELCNGDSNIVCTDTTVVNPWYTVSNEEELHGLKVYCQNEVIITETEVPMTLSLWDMHGRKLEEWQVLEKDAHTISAPLPSGLYIVAAENRSGLRAYKCWVKN